MSRWVPLVNGSSGAPGFFQWKPVAYRQPHPVLEDATPCHHSQPQPRSGQDAAAASGLVRAFYGEPQVFGLNLSFGLAGEPFYNSTRFFSWWVHVRTWSHDPDPPLNPPSSLLQDAAGGRGGGAHGRHLSSGGQHDGGGPGRPHGLHAAGRRLRLCPKEGGDRHLRAHQLSTGGAHQDSGKRFEALIFENVIRSDQL